MSRLELLGQKVHNKILPWIADLLRDRWVSPAEIIDWATFDQPGWYTRERDGGWYRSDNLENFTGYIDLETTGLTGDSVVLCATGLGWQYGAPIECVYVGDGSSVIPVYDSVIANWNQPFDRMFYPIGDDLVDPNHHIDLMGLQLLVRGKPEKWTTRGTTEAWPAYTISGDSLTVAATRVGITMDKSVRTDLVSGVDVPMATLLKYCWGDTVATQKVGVLVLREYLAMAPNPISLYGHIQRHRFTLPISDCWDGYVDRVDTWYKANQQRLIELVTEKAIEACTGQDPFSICIRKNWPEQYVPAKKEPPMIRNHALYDRLSKDNPTLEGYRYKFLWEPIKFGSAQFSLLLGLTWFDDPETDEVGSPILYDRSTKQWSYLGPDGEPIVLLNRTDAKKTLASPMCKGYEDELKSGKISATGSVEARTILKVTQLWKAFRERVSSVHVRTSPQGKYWVPCYSPSGTLSGRAVDKLLLLIGAPKADKGGSEFMSMIEARPGYRIVQADLDSAELVLAGLLSVQYDKLTSELDDRFAASNLIGEKSDGTDTHTIVAQTMGVPRGIAKNNVYGGIYGQGHADRVAKLVTAGLTFEQATKASYRFKEGFIEGLAGSYFNGVKQLTVMNAPTALLGRNVPMAYRHAGRDGVTSRWNHNIQALGEDYLSCLTALTEDIMGGEDSSFVLICTRHDEVVYHCREDRVPELAEALQTAHREIREELMRLINVPNLAPDTWVFFQGVDSGNRYRKSPDANPSTVTTTFPD